MLTEENYVELNFLRGGNSVSFSRNRKFVDIASLQLQTRFSYVHILGGKLNSCRSLLKDAGSNAGEFRRWNVFCSLDIAESDSVLTD